MNNKSLAVGIIALFVASTISPVVISYDEPDERGMILENLTYLCLDESGFNTKKYEYYKEQLYRDYPEHEDKIGNNLKETAMTTSASTVSSSDGPMDSAWPMYCHDVRHTGRSIYNTEANLGGIKWRFRCEGGIDSSPTIGSDGTIYFGGNYGPVYAINPDGTEKWRFNTDGWVTSSIALKEDGTIYFGSWDGFFYCLHANGTLKWRFFAEDLIKSSPAIDDQGNVYFGVLGPGWERGRIYALYQNGTEKWHYDTGDYVFTSPAIGHDNTIYFTSYDNNIYAFDQNGTIKWTFSMQGQPGSPSIGDDGTIYVSSMDKHLYAIHTNGTLKWKCNIVQGCGHTPSIGPDGTIYIGSDMLYAIRPNGTIRWSYDPGSDFYISSKSHAISQEGTIFFGVTKGTDQGDIIAVYQNGSEKWREVLANDWIFSSPSIGSDGTIYIGSQSRESGTAYGSLDAIGGIKIKKPKQGNLYIFDNEILPTLFGNTLIFSKITVNVDVFDEQNVSKVEFYVDEVKQYEDSNPPFEWTWENWAFFKHTLQVTAHYSQGFNSTNQIDVWKFF